MGPTAELIWRLVLHSCLRHQSAFSSASAKPYLSAFLATYGGTALNSLQMHLIASGSGIFIWRIGIFLTCRGCGSWGCNSMALTSKMLSGPYALTTLQAFSFGVVRKREP